MEHPTNTTDGSTGLPSAEPKAQRLEKQLRPIEAAHFATLYHFLPIGERIVLMQNCIRGEEREGFRDLVARTAEAVKATPVTYAQDGKGDEAVAHLHYFGGPYDAWITERDVSSGFDKPQTQAFGLVQIGDNYPELGYVSIAELIQLGIELDLYWTPKTLGEIKAKLAG